MRASLVLLLAPVLMLAGCAGDEPAPETASTALGAPVAGAVLVTGGEFALPILFEGSTATQVFVCADARPPCLHHAVEPGTSDFLIDDATGQIRGGTLSMTWAASSAASEELAFGVMLMGGEGDACAPVSLGIAKGASPLSLDVEALERAICEGEIIHVWASNGIYVGESPAYAQLDVDQRFRIEGVLALTA